jgi:hypothetical protein
LNPIHLDIVTFSRYISAVLLLMIIPQAVQCAEDTQRTVELSSNPLTMEYAHKTYTMLSPVSACNSTAGTVVSALNHSG